MKTNTFQTHFAVLLFLVTGFFVAAIVIAGSLGMLTGHAVRNANSHLAATARPANRFDSAAFLAPHLDRASERTTDALDSRTQELRTFFQHAQQRTGDFAKTALGWSSKWSLLVDAAPFNGSGRNERYLRAKFEQQVFSPDDLSKVIQQAVNGFAGDLTSIENHMLVDIRADLAANHSELPILAMDDQEIRETFHQILATSADYATFDAGGDVATFVAAMVIERIFAKAMLCAAGRTGASATVLGAGAAASWASFGTSIAVALIIDQILSSVWDWAFDPEGNLKANLDSHLQELGTAICDGNGQSDGLRYQLQQFATQRSQDRDHALHELFFNQLR